MSKAKQQVKAERQSVLTEMDVNEAPAHRPQYAIIKSSPQWLEVMERIEKDDLKVGRVLRIPVSGIPVKFARKGLADHLKDYLELTGLNSRYKCWTNKQEEAVYLERLDQEAAVEKVLAS